MFLENDTINISEIIVRGHNMKVVIAIDSLKGSLTSMEAGNCIKEGILRSCEADVVVKPLADGGEGTVEALVSGLQGSYESVEVKGPLQSVVSCTYGMLKEKQTAIIEMSGAAGITLVSDGERNPMNTTTYGVGQVILDAIDKGCTNFIVGIGGSATNDGGMGMLSALGFEFLDRNNQPVALGAKGLKDIVSIKMDNVTEKLKDCTFRIACDVNNPLCGAKGASYVYGPQKGADAAMVEELDKSLAHFADVTAKVTGNDYREYEGAGAAGGMGFAFVSYLNGTLEPGIQLILDAIQLKDDVVDADLVVTGEGRLDFQTAMGKAPMGVAKLAKEYNKRVIAFAGATTDDAVECNKQGIDAYFSIVNQCMDLTTALKKEVAAKNMTDTAQQVFRLIQCSKGL